MSARQPLGDIFNAVYSHTTGAVRVNTKNAVGVAIFALTATSGNVTITEANAASGGTSQNIANGVTQYFTWASGVWTSVTQAAAATVTCVTGGLLYVYIPAVQLSDGFMFVAASHSSADHLLLPCYLQSRRYPPNLPDSRAA